MFSEILTLLCIYMYYRCQWDFERTCISQGIGPGSTQAGPDHILPRAIVSFRKGVPQKSVFGWEGENRASKNIEIVRNTGW